jgi:hypothetical protein
MSKTVEMKYNTLAFYYYKTKVNRKGKTFLCRSCGYTEDSDKNAASNLLLDLVEVPYWVRLNNYNLSGFYWRADGLYNLSQELLVPDTSEVL